MMVFAKSSRSTPTAWVRMIAVAALAVFVVSATPAAAQQERRLGLVIGNAEYPAGHLATAANDAGLVAQTLQAAGFDVMGARDLDGDALRTTFRDFVDKVAEAGPNAVAFVYLSGHGIQLEGENYFVPVDARIDRDVDVPLRALRVSDYIRPLGALKAKAVVVVMDAARDSPFKIGGMPVAGGLALTEPAPGMLYAFNAAPGTIAPAGQPPYGPYAQALAEMMREGGLPLGPMFDRVRLRVNDATQGAEVPWHANQVQTPFVFFERAADAPVEVSVTTSQGRRERPIQAFDDAREAYLAALERDTLQGYLDFLRAYPDHPLAGRARAIVAARREAITWRRTRNADSPEAYWSYLDRYPTGPHAGDARRRLAYLTAPPEPPPRYVAYDYDIGPPPPEEIIYMRRHVIYFADPYWAFAPPPPPPVFFLPPPPPPYFFRPPPPPIAVYVLPIPLFIPMPLYVRQPVYVVAPPPSNVVFRNIHAPVAPPQFGGPPGAPAGPPQKAGPSGSTIGVVAAGAAAGAIAAAAVTLPPSVQKRGGALPPGTPGAGPPGGAPAGAPVTTRTGLPGAPAATIPGRAPGTPPGAPAAIGAPTGPGAPVGTPRQLPGQGGQPLPKAATGTLLPAPTSPLGATGTPPAGSPVVRQQPGQLPPGGPGTNPAGIPGRAGTPSQPPPSTATVTPPVQKGQPRIAAPPALQAPLAPLAPPSPPATVRQQQIDRAQQDRGAVQQQLQQERQRDLERRRQEQAAQQQARQNNQTQELQRQRQQQQEGQRRAMDQQRQQQQAQQQAARQQQAAAQAQAQAAARAQADAQARVRAQATQQPPKKCGAPGLPPCPR